MHCSYTPGVLKCAAGACNSHMECAADAPLAPAVYVCAEKLLDIKTFRIINAFLTQKLSSTAHFCPEKLRFGANGLSKQCDTVANQRRNVHGPTQIGTLSGPVTSTNRMKFTTSTLNFWHCCPKCFQYFSADIQNTFNKDA